MRWDSIVLFDTPSRLAISLVGFASAIRRRTSVSRRVRRSAAAALFAIASHSSVMARERKR